MPSRSRSSCARRSASRVGRSETDLEQSVEPAFAWISFSGKPRMPSCRAASRPLELDQQPARAEEQPFGVRDLGAGSSRPAAKRGGGAKNARGSGSGAQRPVELVEHVRAAALRQPFARQLEQLADGA